MSSGFRKVVQREVGRDDQRLAAAVTAVNHIENLFQPVFRPALHAEVVNDKQRIAAKAGNVLVAVLKAGGKVVEDKGKVRHVDGDFFLHEGVCDTARKIAFPGSHAAPEQAADIVGSHIRPMLTLPAGNPGLRVPAVVVSKVQSRMVGSVKPGVSVLPRCQGACAASRRPPVPRGAVLWQSHSAG